MSDAIGALAGIAGAQSEMPAASPAQEASITPEISQHLGAEFQQAVQNEISFVPDQAGGAVAMGQALNEKLEGLSSYLNQWGVEPAGQTSTATADPANAAELVAQIQATYTFAIETTLVSKGSTETTKIFNTLLKGQ
ncbi:hypothetical protein [Acetobacter oryzoeni]|uniref:Uncharacterized protein n=1 Tax=Acetobacter oryzoeni TaxID=2500548 RepID=A0A5B9GIS8_9PROT|nr:hypothetical protein [Acetobacter oryzoeni]MCP1203060.1 hypothetical protein [Acetobacter oryzoeni]QEE85409.1 hypothetical protein EOV40_006505 [Acetobacter oryzoeni]